MKALGVGVHDAKAGLGTIQSTMAVLAAKRAKPRGCSFSAERCRELSHGSSVAAAVFMGSPAPCPVSGAVFALC